MKRIVVFLFLALMGIGPAIAGVVGLKVGDVETALGKQVLIGPEDLSEGGIDVCVFTTKGVEAVEVSTDLGKNWVPLVMGDECWQGRVLLKEDEETLISLRYKEGGEWRIIGLANPLRIGIGEERLEDRVKAILEDLAQAYSSRDINKYMALISKNYENYPRGYTRLRRHIYNDFLTLNNIVLRFYLKEVYDTGNRVIVKAHWKMSRSDLDETKEGDIEIHLDKSDGLKVLVQKGDLYFGANGTDGEVSVVDWNTATGIHIRVIDKDKAGAGRVYVDAYFYNNGTLANQAHLALNEVSSGVFETYWNPTVGDYDSNDSVKVTYVDEITSDGRRNIPRRYQRRY